MNTIALIFQILSISSINIQDKKDLDLIIVIDDHIVTQSLNLTFIVKTEDSIKEIKTIGSYYPGNVSVKSSDFETMTISTTNKVYLVFNYQVFGRKRAYSYNYTIEYQQKWLLDSYSILRIYNLDKVKYREKYEPLSAKQNYTFELESPNNTFLRIRKPK